MATRPRLIIVDDHPGVIKALSRALSPECDVVGALAHGDEAVDAAARLQPVVVIVDLNLPNVSGIEVCRQIAGRHLRAKTIVISAMADDTVKAEAIAAGASGFFAKSASGELLLAIHGTWTEIQGG